MHLVCTTSPPPYKSVCYVHWKFQCKFQWNLWCHSTLTSTTHRHQLQCPSFGRTFLCIFSSFFRNRPHPSSHHQCRILPFPHTFSTHLNPTLPANFGFTLVMEDKFDSMRLDTKTAPCNLRLNLYKHQANNYVCGSRSHTHAHTHTNSCGYVKRLDR